MSDIDSSCYILRQLLMYIKITHNIYVNTLSDQILAHVVFIGLASYIVWVLALGHRLKHFEGDGYRIFSGWYKGELRSQRAGMKELDAETEAGEDIMNPRGSQWPMDIRKEFSLGMEGDTALYDL